MDIRFKNVNAASAQFADKITNNGPVVGEVVDADRVAAEVRRLRADILQALDRASERGAAAAALTSAVGEVEEEATRPDPSRSRLQRLLGHVATLSAGLTATAGLADSVQAVADVVAGGR